MNPHYPVEFRNVQRTRELLPYSVLMEEIHRAARDLQAGAIRAPARQAVPFPDTSAVMLSMPATAEDISIHKLANVVPSNRARGLATINGILSICDSATGQLQLLLDGPTVTTRRTAAVSMLGIQHLAAQDPRHAAVFGTGTQAAGHIEALLALYPGVRVDVIGHMPGKASSFVESLGDARVRAVDHVQPDVDLVIAATTSRTPVYDEAPNPDRLVIGVGAYREDLAEIGARTLGGSHLYVDDLAGAREEAGDYLQANVDWDTVQALADLLERHVVPGGPAVFKTVGCAAWDLAAARCALRTLDEA